MSKRWFAAVRILVIVVGLMSGLLSIVREFLLFSNPTRFQEAPLFWASARVAFIHAAITYCWIVNRDKQTAQKEKDEIEKRCFDERPQLTVIVHSAEGQKDWVLGGNPLSFLLHNVRGRVARNVQLEPIRSQRGKFELHFDLVPYSKSGLPPQTLSFVVREIDAAPLSPEDTQALMRYHGIMVGQFTEDRDEGADPVVYPMTIRYTDCDEEQMRHLYLRFDPMRYRFLRNTD